MNKLFLISGPSGSGKTTIMRSVMDNEVVSFTTRAMRQGEADGVDYHFITLERFAFLRDNGGLAESSEYGGNHYGITDSELYEKTKHGPAFAIVDYPGVQTLEKVYLGVVRVFIYASYYDCLLNMTERGSSQSLIDTRLATYEQEMDNRRHYDYVIKNRRGSLDEAVSIVRHIIRSEVGA